MTPPSDAGLNTLKMKEESLTHGSSFSMREPEYEDDALPGYWDRFVDGFKRDPSSSIFPADPVSNLEGGRMYDGQHYYDIQYATLETANSGLARKLKGRHLQMIAIGGSIGTSFRAWIFIHHMGIAGIVDLTFGISLV